MDTKFRDALLSVLRSKSLNLNSLKSDDLFFKDLILLDIYKEPFFKIDIKHIKKLQYDVNSNSIVYTLTTFIYDDTGGYWRGFGHENDYRPLDSTYCDHWFILCRDSEVDLLLPHIQTHDASGFRK